ncbi:MAG: hypothetical protein K6T94_09790 [Paenibacillus sp.]|nr:hypothetical protein [Paenibacillus sp.]
MLKKINIVLLVVISGVVAIMGYNFSIEKKNASDEELVKTVSEYVRIHVSGKKQSVHYDREIGKIVVRSELTEEEIEGLYARFDKNKISIASIDAEYVGIISNSLDHPFMPINEE